MLGLGLSLWPNLVPAGTGGTGGYRFWRVIVDNTRVAASNISIPEIRLYAPGMAVSLVTPSTPVTVSSESFGYPTDVVDGFESGWGWVSQSSALIGQWVTLDLGQARQVELVKINPAQVESYRPTRVVIQASNSQLTGYVTLAEDNAPVWAAVGTSVPATTFGPLPTQT